MIGANPKNDNGLNLDKYIAYKSGMMSGKRSDRDRLQERQQMDKGQDHRQKEQGLCRLDPGQGYPQDSLHGWCEAGQDYEQGHRHRQELLRQDERAHQERLKLEEDLERQ